MAGFRDRLRTRALRWLGAPAETPAPPPPPVEPDVDEDDDLFVPHGHFYSPYPDREDADRHLTEIERRDPQVLGVDLDDDRMRAHWRTIRPHLVDVPFTHEPSPGLRYHYDNDQFGHGDAATYWAFIAAFRPARIIEIGSGFSSAVALDAREALEVDVHLTFIEPHTERLRSLLTDRDHDSVEIVERRVQEIDPSLVDVLDDGDLLFIDSSHVAKIGSDVNFELFELLPRLRPGVWVAIHDMFFPFEYPRVWAVDEMRGWNEVYAVRAFLSFNSRFRIEFFNDYFGKREADGLATESPEFTRNPGGLLWLRVTDTP